MLENDIKEATICILLIVRRLNQSIYGVRLVIYPRLQFPS